MSVAGPDRIEAWLDNELSDKDFVEFEDWLRSDPANIETFARAGVLHRRLRDLLRAQAATLESEEEPPIIKLSPPPSLSTTHYPLSTDFVGGPVFSYMVASVILCMMLLGGWVYKVSHVGNLPGDMANNPQDRQQYAPVFIGRVTGMKDCRWGEGEPGTIIGASVPLGRKYSLESGLLQLTYKTGANVILEGPCVFKANADAGGYLAIGKLTARIEGRRRTASAVGAKPQAANPQPPTSSLSTLHSPLFTISTPTAIVTDLGTEFGVEVEQDGSTTSHVFRGSVMVQAVGDKRDVVLRANESAKIGKIVADEQPSIAWLDLSDTPRFVREIPSTRTIDTASAYAEFVMSLNPVVYYRMDQPGKGQKKNVIADYASGKHHGTLRLGNEFGGTPFRPGRFGDSLWLRGPETGDRVIVSDYPKAEDGHLTIAVWVMASGRPGWAMIAENWSTPREGREETDNAGQFHIGLYRTDGDLCARIMQRNGQRVQIREGAEHLFPTGVWQHVALTVDGEYARLYRNGNEVASARCEGVLPQPPVDALGIGCKLDETGRDALENTHGFHYWQGRIDELAIFNRACTAEQIERLASGHVIRNHGSTKNKTER